MIYVIGASSLRHAVDDSPFRLRRRLLARTFATPGLSFNPNARNYLKNLDNLLSTGCWRHRADIVIWHDLINNTLSSHRNNNYNAGSVQQLLHILARHRHRIVAIVYIRREKTPYVFRQLCSSGILILPVGKLLSPKKRRKFAIRTDLTTVHPRTDTERSLLRTVLRNETDLRKLLNRRSQTKRSSEDQRPAGRIARSNITVTVTFN